MKYFGYLLGFIVTVATINSIGFFAALLLGVIVGAAVRKTASPGCGAPVGDQFVLVAQFPVPAPRIQTRLTASAHRRSC